MTLKTSRADLLSRLNGLSAPVYDVGATIADMWGVQLVPLRWELQPGSRAVLQVVNVVCYAPLTPYSEQHDAVEQLAMSVLEALAGTDYQFGTAIQFTVDPDAQPAYQAASIEITYATHDLCG